MPVARCFVREPERVVIVDVSDGYRKVVGDGAQKRLPTAGLFGAFFHTLFKPIALRLHRALGRAQPIVRNHQGNGKADQNQEDRICRDLRNKEFPNLMNDVQHVPLRFRIAA